MQTPCCVSLFVACKTSCSCQRSAETSLPIVSHEWHLSAIAAICLTAARKKSGKSHWKQIFWAQFSDIMCHLWNCKCLRMDFCTDSIQRGIFTHYKHTPVQFSKIPAACCWRRMAYTLAECWSVKMKIQKWGMKCTDSGGNGHFSQFVCVITSLFSATGWRTNNSLCKSKAAGGWAVSNDNEIFSSGATTLTYEDFFSWYDKILNIFVTKLLSCVSRRYVQSKQQLPGLQFLEWPQEVGSKCDWMPMQRYPVLPWKRRRLSYFKL